MQWIVCLARLGHVNEPTVLFWTQMTMDKPLRIPNSFQCTLGYFGNERLEMRGPKCAEAALGSRADIRIVGIERCASVHQEQTGIEVSLKKNVHVNVGAQSPTVPNVLQVWREYVRTEGPLPVLHCEPCGLSRHVINPRGICPYKLSDGDCAEIEGL